MFDYHAADEEARLSFFASDPQDTLYQDEFDGSNGLVPACARDKSGRMVFPLFPERIRLILTFPSFRRHCFCATGRGVFDSGLLEGAGFWSFVS